jgi:plastocyanin
MVLAVATLVAGAVGATALAVASAAAGPVTVEIRIHYSHYEPAWFTVQVGRPVTYVIRNDDPIDHVWIVGDASLHERHRTGTEPYHDSRPTEISIDALTTKRTTITFAAPATLQYICHLPGHEAYGMVGTLVVVSG